MALQFKTPRGTKDILPQDIFRWHYVENTLRKIFELYRYFEIRTPVFEDTELFARGIGQTTDIVQKEMYTFTDKGGKSYTLRPEMTASVVRAYLQHHLGEIKALQKFYYILPMFRQERPQAGRQRQFNQYGIEIIGTQEPFADVEVIVVAMDVLNALKLTNLHLKLNSVGCQVCRPGYKKQLRKELEPVFDQLCADCQNRYHTNPLRILDCKKEHCHQLTENISPIDDFLCKECRQHFTAVKQNLFEMDIDFEQDKRLVRGLDYYTKTAFEVITDQLGAQDAVCGGGRYDMLAQEIGGKNVPAVGFAAGIERLIALIEKSDLFPADPQRLDVYFIGLGDSPTKWVFKQSIQLRRAGLVCEMDYQNRSLKAQLREANKLQARFVVIVGENEFERKIVQLKDMSNGGQTELAFDQLEQELVKQCQTKIEFVSANISPK